MKYHVLKTLLNVNIYNPNNILIREQ